MAATEVKDNFGGVLYGPMDLRMENVPVPTCGDNDALLRMNSVGICGSDIKYWAYGVCGKFVVENPMILGHEASGTVVQVGSKVKHLQIGDRVAIEPGVPCRKCYLCLTGKYNLCPEVFFCATPPDDGNLCRLYKHDADFCFKLPDHVSFEEGALMEPLAVAIHTCRRGGVKPGDNVLVCGAGPVGILCMMVAQTLGVNSVMLTDIDDYRLEVVKKWGANHTLNVKGMEEVEVANKVKEVMGSEPDVVMECSGSDYSIRVGIHAAAPGGCVVQVGRGSPQPIIPLNIAGTKEVDIRGVFRYANCYPLALKMIANGQLPGLKNLVTHHFPLEDAINAFETARSREARAIKVIIDCEKN